jgi:pimeloyl-ACP methyl ester carboxylesterase
MSSAQSVESLPLSSCALHGTVHDQMGYVVPGVAPAWQQHFCPPDGLVRGDGRVASSAFGHSMGGKVAQLAASRRPEGLSGLILVAPAQPTPRRNPEEMRQGQLHAYDNSENVLKTIGSGRLTARPPSPEILEQIVEDSMSGSHEATMAYPMESILEDISAEVANINVPTVLLAGELDQVDSIERHKTEVLAYLPNAEFKIIKGSGHLIPIDEPHELAKEIASFMGGLLLSRNNA